MKKMILCHLMLMYVFISQAQVNPMSPEMFFFQKVPSAPGTGTVCNSSAEDKHKYAEEMVILQKAVDEQIRYLKKEEKKNVSTMQEQAKEKMATQYGLSASDMQKMQSGQMTKEEKKAMADKMLQQQTGLSREEIDNVKGYSKAGKQAWGEGYADQQKAEAEKDPKKNQLQQADAKSLYDMTQERDALNKKLSAKKEKFGQKIREMEADSSMARLLREINDLKAKYYSLSGVDYGQGPEMDQIASSIKSKKLSYCTKMTNNYALVLGEYKESISTDFKDYYRLEELTNEINKQLSGATVNLAAKGLMNYENIKAYIGMLSTAYQYSIYNTGDPF